MYKSFFLLDILQRDILAKKVNVYWFLVNIRNDEIPFPDDDDIDSNVCGFKLLYVGSMR